MVDVADKMPWSWLLDRFVRSVSAVFAPVLSLGLLATWLTRVPMKAHILVLFWRCVLAIAVTTGVSAAPIRICSFNIQFLGHSQVRDNAGLASMLKDYSTVNPECEPTDPNVHKPKPNDHVMCRDAFTLEDLLGDGKFWVKNWIVVMESRWNQISSKPIPGSPRYRHHDFRKYYSQHQPVEFQLLPPDLDDDP